MDKYDLLQFKMDCGELGIDLTEGQLACFQRYYELLIEWNGFMNLTSITEYEEVLKKHFLDSLSIMRALDLSGIRRILDVGTGAGFPGLPLKIAFSEISVTLLDSLGKRVKFLNHVITELDLKDIQAIHGRAEDFARDESYREQFDLTVSRAVANLSSLCEYCIPYTKQNRYFVSYKSGKIEEELHTAQRAIDLLGGKQAGIVRFSLSDAGERSLVVIKKVGVTPKKYPRKAGVPSREPL